MVGGLVRFGRDGTKIIEIEHCSRRRSMIAKWEGASAQEMSASMTLYF
jgi:hypothetical protein